MTLHGAFCPRCREALTVDPFDVLPPDEVALLVAHKRCGVAGCLCPACFEPGRNPGRASAREQAS